MEASGCCKGCRKKASVGDDVTGSLVCSACGQIQPLDNYDPQVGGLQGPQGTFVHARPAGTGRSVNYQDKKIFDAPIVMDDLLFRLGFSIEKANEVRTMVSTITEGEFVQGDWFPVLVGRTSGRPLPIAGVESLFNCCALEC